jgi:alkanesulfonate monooxygenase SsuD/methylene tetrahydromethanopterin reductase-like flavin-dependent oxidoreductase (luciferase family)
MEFGLQFFPDVHPDEKSAAQYFRESLDLVELAAPLGYAHVRTVEHYFHHYGGYSPNPIVFLAAASQRNRTARMVTGAVIPAFNNPLKLAGEIAMLDAISGGRLDVGFARAFIPLEFERFGVALDESVDRYREGIEQIDLLLTQEDVTHHGRFHAFEHVTSLPRPTQKPRPKFYIAATVTPESFEFAGRNGYSLMVNPISAPRLRELTELYRSCYRDAGHPGNGEVMLAFHMFVDHDGDRARRIAKPNIEGYFRSLADAAAGWTQGTTSTAYRGYDKKYEQLRATTFDSLLAGGAAWVGTPAEVREIIGRFTEVVGGFEIASLQVNFNLLPFADAQRSVRLFAEEVMPAFRGPARAATVGTP